MKNAMIGAVMLLTIAVGAIGGYFWYQQRQQHAHWLESIAAGDQHYQAGKYHEALIAYRQAHQMKAASEIEERIRLAEQALSEQLKEKMKPARPDIHIENPLIGVVEIEGKEPPYFRLIATFKGSSGTTFQFTQKNCLLYGTDGTVFEQPIIAIAGIAAGGKYEMRAGTRTNKIRFEVISGFSTDQRVLDTVQVVDVNGILEFTFGREGFFTFEFLWAVPDVFKPKRAEFLEALTINF